MRVAIVGNKEIPFVEEDIAGLYRFARNAAYPHPITYIYSDGWALVDKMAKRYDIPHYVCINIQDAINASDCVVIIREKKDRPWIARYCTRRGKLFTEKVI